MRATVAGNYSEQFRHQERRGKRLFSRAGWKSRGYEFSLPEKFISKGKRALFAETLYFAVTNSQRHPIPSRGGRNAGCLVISVELSIALLPSRHLLLSLPMRSGLVPAALMKYGQRAIRAHVPELMTSKKRKQNVFPATRLCSSGYRAAGSAPNLVKIYDSWFPVPRRR